MQSAQLLIFAAIFQLSDGLQVAANGALQIQHQARCCICVVTCAVTFDVAVDVACDLCIDAQVVALDVAMHHVDFVDRQEATQTRPCQFQGFGWLQKKRFALQGHTVQPVSLKVESGIHCDHFHVVCVHLQTGDLNHMFGFAVRQQSEQQMLMVGP